MWTRSELKGRAREVLRRTYWESVVAYVIVILATAPVSALVSLFPVLNVAGEVAVNLFLRGPLAVGMCFFFMQSRSGPPVVGNLFYAFDGRWYSKVVGAMAWRYLFLLLWSLIPAGGVAVFAAKLLSSNLMFFMEERFVPPPDWAAFAAVCAVIYLAGLAVVVMKDISYSMVPYILSDSPHIGYDRALRLSIAMTQGHKWDIFVLYLSFAGWALLSAATLFVGLLFLAPYVAATRAELYARLRENAIESGLCTREELNLP